MKILFPAYHIDVNHAFLSDCRDLGIEVLMPIDNWNRISFYADSRYYKDIYPNITLISWEEFFNSPSTMIFVPCAQHHEDFQRIYKERGEKDVLIYGSANFWSSDIYDERISDFLISHDLNFHRKSKAKYKMLYFNHPQVQGVVKDYKKSFEDRKISCFINDYHRAGCFEKDVVFADEFKSKFNGDVKFYGVAEPDGYLDRSTVEKIMAESMFTLSIKYADTWGNAVMNSMFVGTPSIQMTGHIGSTFEQYLINQDTSIVGSSVDEIIEKINKITVEEYETMGEQGKLVVKAITNDDLRKNHLKWLLEKAYLLTLQK